MQKAAAKWLMVAGVMIGLTPSGWAEEVDAGKVEYLKSCAPCHGTDGRGAVRSALGSRQSQLI
jgi:mono/diheme cytochrome c family protein